MTDRAVSTVVNYVAALGVMSVLVTGLVMAGGDYVQDQRQQTARAELEVIGQKVSGDLSAAARLARAGDTRSVVIERQFPETVSGQSYTIELTSTGSGEPQLRLQTDSPTVLVAVPVALTEDGSSPVGFASATISGGNVEIVYDSSTDTVTIR